MILYPRSCSSMGLLLTCAGSALPRAVVPALLSAFLSFVFEISETHDYVQFLLTDTGTYPYQVFAYMLGVGTRQAIERAGFPSPSCAC